MSGVKLDKDNNDPLNVFLDRANESAAAKVAAPVDTNVTTVPADPNATTIPVDTNVTTVPADPNATTAPVDTNVTTVPVDPNATTAPVDTNVTTVPVDPNATTLPVDTNVTTVAPSIDITTLGEADQVKAFNSLTGLNVENLESVREYSDLFDKLPEYKKNLELFPKIVEKLRESKNVVSHFTDETAYKATQVVKANPEYKGKEAVLDKIMRSDFKSLNDLDVLRLSADLNAPPGVRNPLRATISAMGLNPDDVINEYDSLSPDDADKIAMATGMIKRDLGKIGQDIEIPKDTTDVLAGIQDEQQAASDEQAVRRAKLEPISDGLVKGLEQLPITDTFNFQLELSTEEKSSYSKFITDAVMSGDFDLSTENGKSELWSVVQDEVFLDKKKEIMTAFSNKVREEEERKAMAKYDNKTPLKQGGPPPPSPPPVDNPAATLYRKMIEEGI